MQRSGVELRQQINPSQPGIDAIGDRNIDQSIFPGERHGGFCALLRQREKPRARTAAHDDGQHRVGFDGLFSCETCGHCFLCFHLYARVHEKQSDIKNNFEF